MPPYEAILYEVRDHIAYVTLNRPEVMNARNRQMTAEIVDAVERITNDDDVRVAVFTGAGDKAFSTGRDLKEAAASNSAPQSIVGSRRSRMIGRGADHVAVANMDKPTIAALKGYAVGGGCELALACDIRIAGDNLRIGLMEAKRGIIPGSGGTQRLARVVGRAWALHLALTAEPIDADMAYRIGLVTSVVPPDQVMVEAERVARQIMENAPIAVRFIKEAIIKGLDMTEAEGLRLEADLSALIQTTEDAKEGPKAFAEKRAPNWTGR
jgi:enoyl-CoA hydratase/carnithine racemase